MTTRTLHSKLLTSPSDLPILEGQVVFTNGCFDILHAGHVTYLDHSRRLGDYLIVGVNSDTSVRRLKGDTRPVNSLDDRMLVLAALESVDFVIPFEADTPLELIKAVKPNVLVKGGDYTIDTIVGSKEVLEDGGKVEIIDLVDGKSTTNIIKKMQQ